MRKYENNMGNYTKNINILGIKNQYVTIWLNKAILSALFNFALLELFLYVIVKRVTLFFVNISVDLFVNISVDFFVIISKEM